MEYMEPKNVSRTLVENKTEIEKEKRLTKRPRSLTTLKLEIISERARKMQRIKDAINSGNYKPASESVAQSLMKHFNEDDLK